MRKNFRWLAAILLLLGCQAWAQDSIGTIEKNFRNTPENQTTSPRQPRRSWRGNKSFRMRI